VYAAPAFWRIDDLWRNVRAETIVDRNNIASVGRLIGHNRVAGLQGKGHSDPVDIEIPTMGQTIELAMRQEGWRFNRHVKRAARLIEESVAGDEFAGSLLAEAHKAILTEDGVERARPTSDSLSSALATIEAFSDAFDVSFYAIG
jgi:hypothetical protein